MVCIECDLVTFDVDNTHSHWFSGRQFHLERESNGWRRVSWKGAPGYNPDKIIVVWSVCLVCGKIDLAVLARGHPADCLIETWNYLFCADSEAERLPALG